MTIAGRCAAFILLGLAGAAGIATLAALGLVALGYYMGAIV